MTQILFEMLASVLLVFAFVGAFMLLGSAALYAFHQILGDS